MNNITLADSLRTMAASMVAAYNHPACPARLADLLSEFASEVINLSADISPRHNAVHIETVPAYVEAIAAAITAE